MSVRARLALVVFLGSLIGFSVVALTAPLVVGGVLERDLVAAEAEFMLEYSPLGHVDDDGTGVAPNPYTSEMARAFVASEFSTPRAEEWVSKLSAAAGGEFAVVFDDDTFARVSADGSYEIESGPIIDLDIPLITDFELDETLFVDAGVIDPATGDLLDDSDAVPPATIGVTTIDGVDLLVSVGTGSVERGVRRVSTILWFGVPIGAFALGAIAWLLAGRALRPVAVITREASTISSGTLDARVPVPWSDDEIADLAITMNEMLHRLEVDDDRRRRFVSDASHELRSPVAVLRNDAEVAQQHPTSTDVTQLAAAVADESARMANILDDLLALARNDEGVAHDADEVDLDDVVLAEAARARRVPIETRNVTAGRVTGAVDELARMVCHLLDNAARHATSRVVVALHACADRVILVVDDDGPGIPPAERARVLERFTRLDEARSRDRGGAGLGLAVVASTVDRAGGELVVGDAAIGGARFTITLPT